MLATAQVRMLLGVQLIEQRVVTFEIGIWVQYMARLHPEMKVYGIDLIGNHPAPHVCRPNAFFRHEVDFNSPHWGFQQSSFDFVHLSQLCGAVPNWTQLYQTVYQ